MEDLKPCKKCGTKASIRSISNKVLIIHCPNNECFSKYGLSIGCDNKSLREAIGMWNSRRGCR